MSARMPRTARVALGTGIAVVTVCIDFPVLMVLLNAFKTTDELNSTQVFPTHFTLANFHQLGGTTFLRYLGNSAIVAGGGTALAIVCATSAGYALSRFRRRGVALAGQLMLAVQMIPVVVTLLPLFLVMREIRLLNSYQGLILLYAALLLPFSTWIARSFFDSIPVEIEESAWVDGASRARSLFSIVAPLAAPGIVSIGVLGFVTAWNEYLLASVFIQTQGKLTVGVGLQLFSEQLASNVGPVMAGAVLAMIPSTVVYLVFQRHFVSGALGGAVKG